MFKANIFYANLSNPEALDFRRLVLIFKVQYNLICALELLQDIEDIADLCLLARFFVLFLTTDVC